jgi:predicted adenine nucleotide alpha hydrolase (AANH) superfamily ATPase
MDYQILLEKTISDITQRQEAKKPSVLMHACCAPCSSYVLEYLTQFFDITLYYYNPNIMPYEEYEKRYAEFLKLLSVYPARLETEKYDNEAYIEAACGMETEKEGGNRCSICFNMRLRKAAEKAKADNYDYFCTTLTISPHKNAGVINNIGTVLAGEYGIKWLYSDFKKRGGYQRSIELCKKYEIYRQNYCGCRFSRGG